MFPARNRPAHPLAWPFGRQGPAVETTCRKLQQIATLPLCRPRRNESESQGFESLCLAIRGGIRPPLRSTDKGADIMADAASTPAVKTVPKPRDQHLRDMADCIRFLSMDAVQQARSGHPGAPMGMADIATVLFKDFMQFDAADPHWFDRDRFVLSNGHASMLLYSLLYLTGVKDMSLDELKRFRQIDSKTAGHPEYKHADGIETTTGPLGQGVANAVGFALAERILNAKLGDDLCKHWTYVFMGDGCLMEGISEEAISMAGHYKLGHLIAFWDNNSITIDGAPSLAVSDIEVQRFRASGWHVQENA